MDVLLTAVLWMSLSVYCNKTAPPAVYRYRGGIDCLDFSIRTISICHPDILNYDWTSRYTNREIAMNIQHLEKVILAYAQSTLLWTVSQHHPKTFYICIEVGLRCFGFGFEHICVGKIPLTWFSFTAHVKKCPWVRTCTWMYLLRYIIFIYSCCNHSLSLSCHCSSWILTVGNVVTMNIIHGIVMDEV